MNRITLWYRIWKLRNLINKNNKNFKIAKQEAINKGKSKDDIHYLGLDYWIVEQECDDEIRELHTIYLRANAQKLIIPMPGYDDETIWVESDLTGRKNLTDNGINILRSAIRNERHERRVGLLTWLAALTGLIGAISGLIAVIGTYK